QLVKRLGVGPQLAGRAGQRLRHPRADGRLQRRERLEPDPGPGEDGVRVVRVVPGPQAKGVARRPQRGPPHAEHRPPAPAAGGWQAGPRGTFPAWSPGLGPSGPGGARARRAPSPSAGWRAPRAAAPGPPRPGPAPTVTGTLYTGWRPRSANTAATRRARSADP